MAFPFLSETGFEQGDRGHFDVESDTDGRLDFPSYIELARTPGLSMPFQGAYCMRVDLGGGVNDAYVQETGAWDLTATESINIRFMFWVSDDITMADDDVFAILQLWSSTNTVEASVIVEYTDAAGLRIGVNEAAAAASASFTPLTTNTWHTVELAATVDAGGGNDGTLDLTFDGAALTQIGSLDQGAITSGVLGVLSQDAGTTAGTLLFDQVIADDARIYGPVRRFSEDVLMTADGHVFVGAGEISNVSLLSGAGTDCVVSLYDTDEAKTNDFSNLKLELKNTANNEVVDPAGTPVQIVRGAYIALSGTNPRALVKICRAHAYGSDAAIRTHAHRRKNNPQEF